jgi:AbrB family looped-hinge helix DNA binding protein
MIEQTTKTIQGSATEKGQTTIPAIIRRRLGLAGAGRYLWIIDGDEIRIRPADFTLESAYASLPFSLATDEIDEAITEAKEEHAARRAAKLSSA